MIIILSEYVYAGFGWQGLTQLVHNRSGEGDSRMEGKRLWGYSMREKYNLGDNLVRLVHIPRPTGVNNIGYHVVDEFNASLFSYSIEWTKWHIKVDGKSEENCNHGSPKIVSVDDMSFPYSGTLNVRLYLSQYIALSSKMLLALNHHIRTSYSIVFTPLFQSEFVYFVKTIGVTTGKGYAGL